MKMNNLEELATAMMVKPTELVVISRSDGQTLAITQGLELGNVEQIIIDEYGLEEPNQQVKFTRIEFYKENYTGRIDVDVDTEDGSIDSHEIDVSTAALYPSLLNKNKFVLDIDTRSDEGMTIYAPDGGVTVIRHTGEYMLTEYYQDRILPEWKPEDIWENLAEGKMYCKEWGDVPQVTIEMIEDSIHWLGFVFKDCILEIKEEDEDE